MMMAMCKMAFSHNVKSAIRINSITMDFLLLRR
jgi:hypothetical protein